MIPNIPLSPQQRRQRRKNLLFFASCTGAAVAFLTYLFLPDIKLLLSEIESDPATAGSPGTAQVQEQAEPMPAPVEQPDAAPAAPPTETPAQGAAEEPKAAATTAPQDNLLTAEAALSSDPILSGAATATAEDTQEQEAPRFSEEELAKLPPWRAAFERLSREQRVNYAYAFSKAKEAYATDQWANCMAHLNECDLIYNNNPDAWNLRACALLACGELDEAETFINRSLELNADDAIALTARAELLMHRRDFRGSISILEDLRRRHSSEQDKFLHDIFTYYQLLCHLMLRQEMEARALVAGLTPLSDSPLYYYSEAAFCIYKGESNRTLEYLRSASTIYGNATASYRKWLNKIGLTEKYGTGR